MEVDFQVVECSVPLLSHDCCRAIFCQRCGMAGHELWRFCVVAFCFVLSWPCFGERVWFFRYAVCEIGGVVFRKDVSGWEGVAFGKEDNGARPTVVRGTRVGALVGVAGRRATKCPTPTRTRQGQQAQRRPTRDLAYGASPQHLASRTCPARLATHTASPAA